MDFTALAQICAPWVAQDTLAAIVRTESDFHPLAIGVNGKAKLARQPASKEEAIVTAKWLISNGYNIDMGLGQVNSANLRKTGLSVEDAFDPCKNLAASATILFKSYQTALQKGQGEQGALLSALSAYNTGSFSKGFNNGYVQKVVHNAGSKIPSAMVIPLVVKTGNRHKAAQGKEKRLMAASRSLSDEANPNINVYETPSNYAKVY